MTEDAFRQWLDAYGRSWETRDAQAAAKLFAAEAAYYWTPFSEPQSGRAEIAAAWHGAVTNQRDIHFEYEILAVDAARGIARWRSRFERLATGAHARLDGIAVCTFDREGLCTEFREWWHAEEKPPAD
jgi:hypothetical protein